MAFLKLALITFLWCLTVFLSVSSSLVNSEPISALEMNAPENIDEVLLGKELFNSLKLSSDNSVSCSSCHNIMDGGDDGRAVSIGIGGQLGEVNAPTVFNRSFDAFYFWDGRAATLEDQVEGPIHNPIEMGSSWQEVVEKLKKDKGIVRKFSQLYSSGLSPDNISKAIAAYERQLITLNAPFDLYLKGDKKAISEQAKSGYQLFKKMGCASCHQGKNVGGNMFQYFGIMGNYFEDRGGLKASDYGRYNVTGRDEDRFKFKVPSLRNIEQTAPYFHDGSIQALEDAIRIMAKYQLGRPITDDQVKKIRAFLLTLTGTINEELI